MSLVTDDHYDAYRYTEVFAASNFEMKLIQLLIASDRRNTEKIMDAWSDNIARMAKDYRRWHEHRAVSPEEFE